MHIQQRNWKLIDLIGQICIIFFLGWYAMVEANVEDRGEWLGWMMVTLLGWQVISMVAHIGVRKHPWIAKARWLFMLAIGFVIATLVICMLDNGYKDYGIIVVFSSACLLILTVIGYLIVTIVEYLRISRFSVAK